MLFIFAMMALVGLFGCSKKDNSGALINNTALGNCTAGQVRTASGQCLNQLSCPTGQGWDGSQCVAGTVVTVGQIYGGNQLTFSNTLQIINRDVFERYLEAMGVCEYSGLYSIYYGDYFGINPIFCRAYSNIGFITMQFFPEAAQFEVGGNVPAFVTIVAGANSPATTYTSGPFGNYLSTPNSMTTYIINNNTGFELQPQGVAFGIAPATVSIRTEQGNYMTDSNFEISLRMNGVVFARSFVNRHF